MEKRGLCVGFLPTYSLSFSLVSDYDCVMHNEIAFMKLETRVTLHSVANFIKKPIRNSKCTVVAKKDKTTLLVKLLTKSFYPFWSPLYLAF